MEFILSKLCPNVYNIRKELNPARKILKLEDVDKFTLIVCKTGTHLQTYHQMPCEIYYIEKYDRMFTPSQAKEFCDQHPEENFILVDNERAHNCSIWFYVVSQLDHLEVHCFHVAGGGHLTKFAIFQNVFNKSKWQEFKPLSGTNCYKITNENEAEAATQTYHTDSPEKERNAACFFRKIGSSGSYRNFETDGKIINVKDSPTIDTGEILRQFLRLTGKTRISYDFNRDYYRDSKYKYDVGKRPEIEDESIVKRYGLPVTALKGGKYHNYSYWHGSDWMWKENETFDSTLSKEDWERAKTRLEAKLLQMDNNDEDAYAKVLQASILVINDPIPGHRRPSYHYILGCRSNHITEVVELARGELLIKDMVPASVYSLTDSGEYIEVLYDVKSTLYSLITSDNTEIDEESFNKWAEERSLHPELLRLLNQSYFGNIRVELIKLFNKLPFGSLLINQLITAGYGELAIKLAEYITDRAYDFHIFCGQLSDLFPDCNDEATSLFKILDISRTTAKYLLKDADTMSAEDFVMKFTAVHHYDGNMVLSNEAIAKVETYLELYKMNHHKYHLSWGDREFDFLNYPKLAKQVLRMFHKIEALKENGYSNSKISDITNKYNEIVTAYCSFLDYSSTRETEEEKKRWLPENQRLFVEFSLTGTAERPLDPIEELSSREKAANAALKTYQDAANAKIMAENEEKFKVRRVQINKLRSLAQFEKENLDFKGYTVMAPTQLYGLKVNGSVEQEADFLDHCLFRQYTNRMINGDYTAVWLRSRDDNTQSIITIGITKKGRIEQTRGMSDRDATPEEARAIAAWAVSKKGMVTFRSEGVDVAPGGWPKGVPVPSLPAPDPDWLEKLALNH